MNGREIIVGVTGGIAAYKTAALVSRLSQAGAIVTVAMTESAKQFVGPTTFAALSCSPVASRVFHETGQPLGAHIALAERAELMCVAPATANFLAKTAQGIADDLLSTLYLSFSGPVMMAPAMSNEMWEKPAVQRNMTQLREDGVTFIGPDEGWLSCRKTGVGRMSDPNTLFAEIQRILGED